MDPGRGLGGQELVQEVTMAGLYVDEAKPNLLGEPSRFDIGVDQPMQVVVRPDYGIVLGVDPVLLVEQGMMTGDAGLPAHLVVGTAESAPNG